MRPNLTCRTVRRQLLTQYEAGELEIIPKEIASHLNSCSSCQIELENLMHLHGVLDRLPVADPGALFWQNMLPKIHQRMEEARAKSRRLSRTWIPSLGMALATLVLLLNSTPRMAPPSWFQVDSLLTQMTPQTSDQTQTESTGLGETISSLFNRTELEFLVQLSAISSAASEDDPIQTLTQMKDERIAVFLEKLKEKSVLKPQS